MRPGWFVLPLVALAACGGSTSTAGDVVTYEGSAGAEGVVVATEITKQAKAA